MLGSFTLATFADRVGDTFRVWFGLDEPVDVELISVVALGSDRGRPAGGRRPFSLEFLDAGQEVHPQRIYPMEHAAMPRFEIFLVPIGATEEGVRYQAIFT